LFNCVWIFEEAPFIYDNSIGVTFTPFVDIF
jgi:hypothetical protein